MTEAAADNGGTCSSATDILMPAGQTVVGRASRTATASGLNSSETRRSARLQRTLVAAGVFDQLLS